MDALTPEDLAWVEQAHRDGRLPEMTLEEALAEIRADRKRLHDRLRKKGIDLDSGESGPVKE